MRESIDGMQQVYDATARKSYALDPHSVVTTSSTVSLLMKPTAAVGLTYAEVLSGQASPVSSGNESVTNSRPERDPPRRQQQRQHGSNNRTILRTRPLLQPLRLPQLRQRLREVRTAMMIKARRDKSSMAVAAPQPQQTISAPNRSHHPARIPQTRFLTQLRQR